MVEKQYGWFDKRSYVGQRAQATIVEFLGETEKGALKLLIEAGKNKGEVELYRENRNRIIDLCSDDESTWAGKRFMFSVSKNEKGQNIFAVG